MDIIAAACILLMLVLGPWICWNVHPKLKKLTEAGRKVPGPIALPVIGTMYKAIGVQRKDLFDTFDRLTREYWPIYKTWNGPFLELQLSDADHIEEILHSSINIDKGYLYSFFRPWLGQSLLLSGGQHWHTRRKLLTSTFHFKILDSFQSIFGEVSQILVSKLENEVGNPNGFDISPYITHCTLDIIGETAMGTKLNAQGDTHSQYVKAIQEIFEITVTRILRPWLHIDFLYYLTKDGKRYKECLNILHSFTRNVIRERKRSLAGAPDVQQTTNVRGQKRRLAFLDLLLEVSEGGTVLTDEDIREDVDTFMFAGHDTVSTSISWTLFLLGNHPEIQERVFEELAAIFQDSDRLPNMQDLAEMKYLERVIKESLRLYPSVPFIARQITEDLKIGVYDAPAGCQVTVHIYHVHRNPKYFPEPDKFDPDNFLPEKVQGRHPYAYIPFSAGSRNCIGQRFALQQHKTVLSAVLRRFRVLALQRHEDVKIMGEFVLRPQPPVRLALRRR